MESARLALEVLTEDLPGTISKLSFAKSMRWNSQVSEFPLPSSPYFGCLIFFCEFTLVFNRINRLGFDLNPTRLIRLGKSF